MPYTINPIFEKTIEERLAGIIENNSNYFMIPPEHQVIYPVELGEKEKIKIMQYPTIFGLNWEGVHKVFNEHGAYVSSQIDALNAIFLLLSNNKIFDGNGRNISEKRDNILEGFIGGGWEYLSTKFTKNENELIVNHNYFINEEGKLIPKYSKPIEDNVLSGDHILIDLNPKSFNDQGMPIIKSESENYQKRKNIFYFKPLENGVARLYAYFVRDYLDCSGDPASSVGGFGARAKFMGE